MSFGHNTYGHTPYGRGRGTVWRGVGAPTPLFSSVLPSGGSQAPQNDNQMNPLQTHDKKANKGREQYIDVYQQHSQITPGYSATLFSQSHHEKDGDLRGSWPSVASIGGDASWQSWQGDMTSDQLQNKNKPTNMSKSLHQCSLCNIDFTDKKHYDLHCAGILHKQKVCEKEPQSSEKGVSEITPETGGSSWPSREAEGNSWPSRHQFTAHMSSGEGRSTWDDQLPSDRHPQAPERPKKQEQQSRDRSQSEPNVEFLKPNLKNSPVNVSLEQISSTSQFPGADRGNASVYIQAGERRPAGAARQGDETRQFGFGTRSGWNLPFDETRRRQDSSLNCNDTDRFQQRNNEELFSSGHNSLLSEGHGDAGGWNRVGGDCFTDNAHQKGGDWHNQERSSFGKQQYPRSMSQYREGEGMSYDDKYGGIRMYNQAESIPGLDMLPGHQDDMDGQSEWYSQKAQQTGSSSNCWQSKDSAKQKEGRSERGMSFRDSENRERGQLSTAYVQHGMTTSRSENQHEQSQQSHQKILKSCDALHGQGSLSDSYKSASEHRPQSGDYRQYPMTPEGADSQHGRGVSSGSYKPPYEQQGVASKSLKRQPERGRQSSLYDKLQMMSKAKDGQQGRRLPSDNFAPPVEVLQRRGIPTDKWQQQGQSPGHIEAQLGPGMTYRDRQQQGQTPTPMEGQCNPGMLFGDRQWQRQTPGATEGQRRLAVTCGDRKQCFEGSWMPKSSGDSTNSWQQDQKPVPWHRQQEAGMSSGNWQGRQSTLAEEIGWRQNIQPLMPIGVDVMPPDLDQVNNDGNLSRPERVRDFRHPDFSRDFGRPDGVFDRDFRQPDGDSDFRRPEGGRDFRQPGSGHQQQSAHVTVSSAQTSGTRQDHLWSKQEQGRSNQPVSMSIPSQLQPGHLQKSTPDPEQTGKLFCTLCDIQLSDSNKTSHEASIKHCAKYLYRQIVLGCKEFDSQFPDAVFGLTDAYSVAPPAQKPVKLLIYRCGLVMKYECAACSLKCFGQSQWHTHIRSTKHFTHCQDVISKKGLEGFLDFYGVLPLVQPEDDDSPMKTPDLLTESHGQDARLSNSKKYEVTYPVTENKSKLTVYEYSHTSTTNTPTTSMQAPRYPKARILDPSGVKRHEDRVYDSTGVHAPAGVTYAMGGIVDPSVVSYPIGGDGSPHAMSYPVGGAINPGGVAYPVSGALDAGTVGQPMGAALAEAKVSIDSTPKPAVFEYSHTSRVVTPQPSMSVGVLDEESIKKIADTISDIKNASKQQDNSTNPEGAVKGIFPIVHFYSTTDHRSNVTSHGIDHSRQTYQQGRKEDRQRIDIRGRERPQEWHKKEENSFSHHTRTQDSGRTNLDSSEEKGRYSRLFETGADSRRQTSDGNRCGPEHHGKARSQEQKRPRRDDTTRQQDAHRSTSQTSGSSEGSRKRHSDDRTKPGIPQKQAVKQHQVSRSKDIKPLVQPLAKTEISKKDNEQKQFQGKSAASKQPVLKESQFDKDREKMSTETQPHKVITLDKANQETRSKDKKTLAQTPIKTPRGKMVEERKQLQGNSTSSKELLTKMSQVEKEREKLAIEKPCTLSRTERTKKEEEPKPVQRNSAASKQSVVKQSHVQKEPGKLSTVKTVKHGERTGSKPFVVKTDVKHEAKTQQIEMASTQPAAKDKADKKADVRKPTKVCVATEKQTGNGMKKVPVAQGKTEQKGSSMKEKSSKVTDDKKASESHKTGSMKQERPAIDQTRSDNRERSSSRKGDRSDVSSQSNKADSEKSFSWSRERKSGSHSRDRLSGKEHARTYASDAGKGRPVDDRKSHGSSCRDRGSQLEGNRGFTENIHAERERHDPHAERSRHERHSESARREHSYEHARHDPGRDRYGPRARQDYHAEHDRRGLHTERARHNPHAEMHAWPMEDSDGDLDRQRGYRDRHIEDYNKNDGLQQWLNEEHWLDRFGEEEEEEDEASYGDRRFIEVAEPEEERTQEAPPSRERGRGRGQGDARKKVGPLQLGAPSHEPPAAQTWRSRGADRRVSHDRRDVQSRHQMTQRDDEPEELMDMDTAVTVFTQTLQQFVNSLQGQTTSDRHMGCRVARLTPEEHQFVKQIEAMTGIHDAGTILSAIDILQNMDSKVIQTLGSLDPAVIQDLFTGKLSLQGCGGMDMQQMVQSMLCSGGGLQVEAVEGFGRRVEVVQSGEGGWRGRGRGNGRGRFQKRRGMLQKRTFCVGHGQGGPPTKRGR